MGNSPVHKRQPSSPLARVTTNLNSPDLTQEIPAPRPVRQAASSSQPSYPTTSSTRYTTHHRQQAIPSSSALTKSVREKVGETKREGSGKGRQHSKRDEDEAGNRYKGLNRLSSALPASRHAPNHRQATPLRKSSMKLPAGTPRFAKVHLPDVTGLTSAVESPAKMGLEDGDYKGLTGLHPDDTTAREVEGKHA